MRKTTVRKVLREIKEHKPSNPSEFTKNGIPLRRISEDQGLFRKVYKVTNCDLVVKFPKGLSGAKHTRDEVARIRKLRRWGVMKSHLPEIYYYDSESSVLVISYHPKFTTHEKEADAMGRLIQKLVKAATGIPISDVHSENVNCRNRRDNTAVIIDLGY